MKPIIAELKSISDDLKEKVVTFKQEEFSSWSQSITKKINQLLEEQKQTNHHWDKFCEDLKGIERKNNFPLQNEIIKDLKKIIKEVISSLNVMSPRGSDSILERRRKTSFKGSTFKKLSLNTSSEKRSESPVSPRGGKSEQAEAAPLTKNLIISNKGSNEDSESESNKNDKKKNSSSSSPSNKDSTTSQKLPRLRSRSVQGTDNSPYLEVAPPPIKEESPSGKSPNKYPTGKRMFGLRTKPVRDSRTKHSDSISSMKKSTEDSNLNRSGNLYVEAKLLKKSDDKKNRISSAFSSFGQKPDQTTLRAFEYTTNIIKLFENFPPQEWQSAPTEKRDKLKEEIALLLLEYSNNTPNKRRLKKGKFTSQTVVLDKVTPRSGSCQLLNETVQTFIQTILVFITGHNENLINPSLKTTDIRQTLSNNILNLSKLLIEMDRLFPSAIQPDTCLSGVWNRIVGNLGALKGTKQIYDEKNLHEGQTIKELKKGLLDTLLLHIENLYYTTSSLSSFFKDSQTDNQDSRLCILAYFSAFKESLSSAFSVVETLYDLEESIDLSTESVPAKVEDESLWKDSEDCLVSNFDQNDKFRPGTLNNLILRITSSEFDKKLALSFITGYVSFCSPSELYLKLLQRYKNPTETDPELVMKSTAEVVQLWCKKDFYNIHPSLLSQIKKFAETVLSKDNTLEISQNILKQICESEKIKLRDLKLQKPIPIFAFDIQPHQFLKYADELEVAEQMTLIDLEIYNRIKMSELTNLKWSKEKLKFLSPNIGSLLQRINRISYWVASMILFQQKLVDRVKVLKKIISIAKCLSDLNNYNSLIGVLVGLNMAPISRLKHTFAGLSKKVSEEFEIINQMQDPTGSFKNLRNVTKNLGTVNVPYIGIHLSDLTMIDENAEIITVGEKQLINIHKYHLVVNSIEGCLRFRKNNKIEDLCRQEPLYTVLYFLPSLGEKELWQLSMEREPRNCSAKDLE